MRFATHPVRVTIVVMALIGVALQIIFGFIPDAWLAQIPDWVRLLSAPFILSEPVANVLGWCGFFDEAEDEGASNEQQA